MNEYSALIDSEEMKRQPMVLLDAVRKRMMEANKLEDKTAYVFWRHKYEILHDKAVENAYAYVHL